MVRGIGHFGISHGVVIGLSFLDGVVGGSDASAVFFVLTFWLFV